VTNVVEVRAPSASRWQRLLGQLALSVPEIAIAWGLGFAVFWGSMALGCRFVGTVCDSAGGLVIVILGLGASVAAAIGYWLLALSLGLAGLRRSRYVLDAVVALIGFGTYAGLVWREHRTQAEHREAREAAARREAADREAWIATLMENPNGHGVPGVVPPMLNVIDDGRGALVTNMSQEWLTVALARVLLDNQRGWRACPMLTVGEVSDYYRFSIGPGQTAQYAPLPDCAAGFEGAPIEYRVGDPLPNTTGWWSDSAFDAPNGRLL
jgi:hypothetical protein